MPGHGWRNMYYLTGLPGWVRFGYSPGWIDRSPSGVPPAAQYLTQTGQLPQFTSYLQGQGAPAMPAGGIPKEQEILVLEKQAMLLEQQLEQIKKRIEELTK